MGCLGRWRSQSSPLLLFLHFLAQIHTQIAQFGLKNRQKPAQKSPTAAQSSAQLA